MISHIFRKGMRVMPPSGMVRTQASLINFSNLLFNERHVKMRRRKMNLKRHVIGRIIKATL